MLANERRPKSQVLSLGDHRGWGLALADKATTQAQCGNDQRECQRNFLHVHPPLQWAPSGPVSDEVWSCSVAEAARPPVQTKKDRIDVGLCTERDASRSSGAGGAEVRVIVLHKHRPIWRELIFGANANRPASASSAGASHFQASGIPNCQRILPPGSATLEIKQPVRLHRKTYATCEQIQPIVFKLGRVAGSKSAAPLCVRPVEHIANAEHPGPGLPVAPDLAAADEAGTVGGAGNRTGRCRDFSAAPPGAGIAADVAAGPGTDRGVYRRCWCCALRGRSAADAACQAPKPNIAAMATAETLRIIVSPNLLISLTLNCWEVCCNARRSFTQANYRFGAHFFASVAGPHQLGHYLFLFSSPGTSIPPARPPLPYWPHEYGYTFAAAIRGLYLADAFAWTRSAEEAIRRPSSCCRSSLLTELFLCGLLTELFLCGKELVVLCLPLCDQVALFGGGGIEKALISTMQLTFP